MEEQPHSEAHHEPPRETDRDRHREAHGDDARWMTFQELAAIRGTSKRAAVTLIRRHGWRRQRDNQNRVIALVPLTWATTENTAEAHEAPHSEAHSLPAGQAYTAFETALAAIEAVHARELATLREQLATAEAARIGMQALVEQFATEMRDAAEERQRADRLNEQVEALSVEVVQTEKQAEALVGRAERAEADRDAAKARSDRAEQAIAVERERAERAEQGREGERARADALRDRLNAMQEQLADAHAALQAAESANVRAVRAEQDKERAETAITGERQRADALRDRLDGMQRDLDAARERMQFSQAALDQAQAEARKARDAAEALHQAEADRKARGLVARLRAAWRGE
jgi:chromosome segregation ATPase